MRRWKGSVDWRDREIMLQFKTRILRKKRTFGDLNVDGKVTLTWIWGWKLGVFVSLC